MLDYSLSVAMKGNGRGPAYEVIPDPGTLNVIVGTETRFRIVEYYTIASKILKVDHAYSAICGLHRH